MRSILPSLLCLLLAPAAVAPARSENIVFPADSGIVDVTKPPYHAVPNDGRDDTAAIQKALDDHPSANAIIYLPNGTYHVSDTLTWPKGPHGGVYMKRTILQGQSEAGSVLQLADRASGFTDPDAPKPVIYTGEKPAQRFRNSIRNLTVDTGRGNPGAVGVQYIANNQGSIHRLTVRSGDGAGVIGLDLGYTPEQGPCLIKNVTVRGFDVGVRNAHIVDSVTMEFLTLAGQNRYGMTNDNQVVSIRGLKSRNAVPAVLNRGDAGLLTLLDAELTGTGAAKDLPAILNEKGVLFARDVTARGYRAAIENRADDGNGAKGPRVREFTSHPVHTTSEGGPKESLRLPVKETPELPWDPLEEWTSPLHYGGRGDGKFDNTEALQKAIDSGKRTLYLPNGNWRFDGEVLVRGNVRRILGCEAKLTGKGTLRIVEGRHPVVRIERIDMIYSDVGIEHRSPRALVISSVNLGGRSYRGDEKSGELYLEDVVGGPFRFKGQRVWARQLNPETEETKIVNEGGTLWILGYKTEKTGTPLENRDGAKAEVLGAFIYANTADEKPPMFVNANASLAFTMAEWVLRKAPYERVVAETQDGVTKILSREECIPRGGGSMVPLYVSRK